MSELRVLFITNRWDAPYRYRCVHACEQLRKDGAVANILSIADGVLLRELGRYSVVVLFRLPWDERVEAVVDAARRLGVPLVFDVDDLVFDPAVESLMPFRRRYSNIEWRGTYGHEIAALRRTLEPCDLVIGSTEAIAEHARSLGKRAVVHPNVVPSVYLRRGRLLKPLRRSLRGKPTIGYFSGSNTHDDDFAAVAPALASVLRDRPDAMLLVCGYIDLGVSLREFEARVMRLPYMHWKDYACAYAACHVNVAPLAAQNDFTDSKSALKFFEAGAFFTPTVASPSRPMLAAITSGESGYIANSIDEWIAALHATLEPAHSNRLGEAARASVERFHSEAAVRGNLAKILGEIGVAPAGAKPRATSLETKDDPNTPVLLDRAKRPVRFVEDLGRIVRAVRSEPREWPDAARVDALVDALERSAERRRDVARAGISVLLLPDTTSWKPNEQLDRPSDLLGEWRSTGTDPYWVSPHVSIDAREFRYLVVRLRASAEAAHARAQLYWHYSDQAGFDENQSIDWPLVLDGCDAVYIVDLHRSPVWQRSSADNPVARVRVDPLDRPGSVRLSAVLLLPANWAERGGDLVAPESATPLPSDWSAARANIEQAVARLGVGECLVFRSPAEPDKVRGQLSRWSSIDAVVDRLIATEGATRFTIRKAAPVTRPPVDIVVPVFNALDDTLKCVRSVVRHAEGDYRLVVIDDASPDERVWPALSSFAREHEQVVLLRNEENLGFVRTSNRGIAHAKGRDVVLLNSDTEVYEGFLSRLADGAYSGDRIGIACPTSNNATVCSVPDFCRPNELPPGMSPETMADLVWRSSLKRRPDLVTPVGFCMYMRADFLEEAAGFDEELFGRGFGEENELGERAKKLGWRIVLADDVYVWHRGKASFGEGGQKLESKNAPILERRHPGYHASVAQFISSNPLAPIHQNLRLHLERRSHTPELAPLMILHASPFGDDVGGAEHCVRDLVQALQLPRVVIAYPTRWGIEVAEVLNGDLRRPFRYHFPLTTSTPRFCHEHEEALKVLDEIIEIFWVGWVHLHHLMYWPLTIGRFLREKNIPYLAAVHDFYWACPNFNLLDVRSWQPCCPSSCGNAAKTGACFRARCTVLGEPVPTDPSAFVEGHREAMLEVLSGASAITAPSESAAATLKRIVRAPELSIAVVPHGYDPPARRPRMKKDAPGPLRIAIVGAIAHPSKGADTYIELIRQCPPDFEWHIFGQTDVFGFETRLKAIEDRKIVRHGRYERTEIVGKLSNAGADVGLLLPPCAETFSYTLSELLAAGVPVVAIRLGALADRLEGRPHAVLVDAQEQAAAALEGLSRDREQLRCMQSAAAQVTFEPTSTWAARFQALYDSCAAVTPVRPVQLTPDQFHRLYITRMEAPALAAPASVVRPAAQYAGSWWYQKADSLKGFAPESVRQIVRRRLAANGARTVRRFRLPGRGVTIGADIRLDRRYIGTARFTALSGDPHFLIRPKPIDPKDVDLIRFNLWCSQPGYVFAQLYWKHEGDDYFAESRSITVPLDGQSAAWQEYMVDLNGRDARAAWYEGGPIVELRFDPINVPGLVCLGELGLCRTEG